MSTQNSELFFMLYEAKLSVSVSHRHRLAMNAPCPFTSPITL